GESADEPGAAILRIVFTGVADCAAAPRSGEVPLTVQFTDASTVPDPVAWAWVFGDGGTSAERDPIHGSGPAGPYGVALSVTGRAGVVQTFKPSFIRVDPKPVPRVDAISPDIGCDRLSTRVAIRGGNFSSGGAVTVTVGGERATEVTV